VSRLLVVNPPGRDKLKLKLHTLSWPPQDWSDYKALEFFLHLPVDYPVRGMVLKFGIHAGGGTGRMIWRGISPESLESGAWTRILFPLRRANIDGDLTDVRQVRFYVAESWYEDGDALDLRIDDLSLLKEYIVPGASEWIRVAGVPLDIPDAARAQTLPVLYPVLPLEFIYPDSALSARTPLERLSTRAALGETTAVTFAVLAGNEGIQDLKLTSSDLRGPNERTIPKEQCDARVVKVWEQAALHWEVFRPTDAILVPELLLKDDRIAINERRDAAGQYDAPHVLNVPFGTDVPAHTVKQVWLSITVPRDAVPGLYSGSVRLSARRGLTARTLPFTLEVLPFELPEPKLTYGAYYRWRPWREGLINITEDRFLADLRELKTAGFHSLSCYDPVNLEKWIDAMNRVGMRGPVVILVGKQREVAERAVAVCQRKRMPCYFYGVDEPNGKEKFGQHKLLSALLHGVGGKVMTAILPRTARNLLEQGEGLDWANHSIQNGHSSAYIAQRRAGTADATAPFETYYWQVYEENPTRNRMLCGFYLWTSGLDGAFPYEYQCPPGMLPYTKDARETMHNVKEGGTSRTFRAWNLTYPSREGPVSTLQWEGCRLGVNDVRYLTVLERYIATLEQQGRTDDARAAQVKLSRIVSPFTKLPVDPSVHANPYVEPKSFENARAELVSLILQVREQLK